MLKGWHLLCRKVKPHHWHYCLLVKMVDALVSIQVKCQGPPAPCVPCKKQGIQCNFRDQARSRRPRNKEVRKESFDDSFGSRGLNHSIETSMEPEGYEEGMPVIQCLLLYH